MVTALFLQETGHAEKEINLVMFYAERQNRNVTCQNISIPYTVLAKLCNCAIYEVNGNFMNNCEL